MAATYTISTYLFRSLGFLVAPPASHRSLPRRPPSAEPTPSVYAQLRDDIVRGRMPPGIKLTEVDVAARCGVSRTPAREAIRRLLADGLLVPAGGGGRPRAAVAPLSTDAAAELYAAAAALEGIASRGIAALPVPGRRALATALRKADAGFRRALATSRLDFDRLFARHDDFHRRLMDACAGPRLRRLLQAVRVQLDRYEWVYGRLLAPDFSPTFAEHLRHPTGSPIRHRRRHRASRARELDQWRRADRPCDRSGMATGGRSWRTPQLGQPTSEEAPLHFVLT